MRESQILKMIFAANQQLPDHVTIPPGDDMGAVRLGDCDVLVTTDQLVEAIHYDPKTTSIEQIGRKAITRNLSDVAAMGAKPVGAVAAACVPASFGESNAKRLFDIMRSTAEHYKCPLFGGDVTIWNQPLVLTVTLLGDPAGIEPILRSGAQTGDSIYVTGHLGGSLESINGYVHHLDFEPRIDLARELVARFKINSMIDLSDGLARDLGHICRNSGASAIISSQYLPISDAAIQRSSRLTCPPWQCALGDGEDYELCFTSPSDTQIPGAIGEIPVTRIGEINALNSASDLPVIQLNLPDGSSRDVGDLGWEHHDS